MLRQRKNFHIIKAEHSTGCVYVRMLREGCVVIKCFEMNICISITGNIQGNSVHVVIHYPGRSLRTGVCHTTRFPRTLWHMIIFGNKNNKFNWYYGLGMEMGGCNWKWCTKTKRKKKVQDNISIWFCYFIQIYICRTLILFWIQMSSPTVPVFKAGELGLTRDMDAHNILRNGKSNYRSQSK